MLFLYTLVLGIINRFEPNYVFGEVFGFLSPILIIALYNKYLLPPSNLKKIILFGVFLYSLFKVVIVALISMKLLVFTDFTDFIQNAFNYKIVSMLIIPELNIVRIYIVNDLLVAFSPLLFLSSEKIIKSKLITTILFTLITLSMLISYSRYLIAIFVIVLLLAIFKTNNLTKTKIVSLLSGLAAIALWLIIFGLPEQIRTRFSSTDYNNMQSDAIRDYQLEAILEMITNHLFFGAGAGSYNPYFIRFEYVYELQLLSFVFKFGIPAFILLCAVILMYFINNFELSFKSIALILLLLSSSIFNPYLETTVFGVSVMILYLEYGKKPKPLIKPLLK